MANEKINPFLQGVRLSKYILKNISGYDINLSDLGYVIPYGKSRNLLGRTAHLKYEDIKKSRESGSIAKRLGKFIVEVDAIIPVNPPLKEEAEKVEAVALPQRTKSLITIDMNEMDINIEIVQNEEDELLKQMEQEYEENIIPVVANEKKEKA